MSRHWIIQLSPCKEHCRLCRRVILATTQYVRACVNPDSPDENGYDFCYACRTKFGCKPPEPETFT